MDILFIMVGIVLCAFFISKANIKITIAYKHPQPDVDKITQLEVDENSAQDKPTYDDIVAEMQRILGGDPDGD